MRIRALGVAALLVAALLAMTASPALADDRFVKYYVVGEPGTGPQTLAAVAEALLGSADRQTEIFALNAHRRQPDGSYLTASDPLKPGWTLVLPWDAAGPGVRYGQLPAAGEQVALAPPSGPGVVSCGLASASGYMPLSWAQLRLAPSEAWARSRGAGVTVAVIDAPLPTDTPGLTGRVLPAIAISAGPDSSDCPGRGAALAGILAAAPRPSSNLIGMAPEATVLPVEVAVAGGYVLEADVARALDAALRAQAGIVMIPAQIRAGGAELAQALVRATEQGAVVVLAAPARGSDSAALDSHDGVLRVGAVAADDRLAGDYVPGSVDVLAPGMNVLTVGEGGEVEATGTDFAVPFVAGLAALIRAAEPGLPPSAVAQRIVASADGGVSAPDAGRGWGVIDPGVALGVVPPRVNVPGPSTDDDGDDRVLAVVVASGLLIFILATITINWVVGNRSSRSPRPSGLR